MDWHSGMADGSVLTTLEGHGESKDDHVLYDMVDTGDASGSLWTAGSANTPVMEAASGVSLSAASAPPTQTAQPGPVFSALVAGESPSYTTMIGTGPFMPPAMPVVIEGPVSITQLPGQVDQTAFIVPAQQGAVTAYAATAGSSQGAGPGAATAALPAAKAAASGGTASAGGKVQYPGGDIEDLGVVHLHARPWDYKEGPRDARGGVLNERYSSAWWDGLQLISDRLALIRNLAKGAIKTITGIPDLIAGIPDAAIEAQKRGNDLGNALDVGISLIGNALFGTPVYTFRPQSRLFRGFDTASKKGEGLSYTFIDVIGGALSNGAIPHAVQCNWDQAEEDLGGLAATLLLAWGAGKLAHFLPEAIPEAELVPEAEMPAGTEIAPEALTPEELPQPPVQPPTSAEGPGGEINPSGNSVPEAAPSISGVPNPNGSSTLQDLQGAANRANAIVGPGKGPVHGTRVHTAFKGQVQALGNDELSTEVSYLNGYEVDRGTPGSIRVDVVEGPKDSPTAIYDLVTISKALFA
jgi:hypothetical protein